MMKLGFPSVFSASTFGVAIHCIDGTPPMNVDHVPKGCHARWSHMRILKELALIGLTEFNMV